MITQTENLLHLNKKLENQLIAFRNKEAKEDAEKRFQNVVSKMHSDKLTKDSKRSNLPYQSVNIHKKDKLSTEKFGTLN